jgi:hypothetical protein
MIPVPVSGLVFEMKPAARILGVFAKEAIAEPT